MLVRIDKYKDLRVEENIDLTIGRGCSFNGMVIHNDGAAKCSQRAKVSIGRYFHSGKKCVIRTSDHDFERGYPMVPFVGYKVADVSIGDYVWFGDDVLVMKGVTIGNGVIIQARSVVVSDIPDLAIAGGHPCRPFSKRNAEDYAFFSSLGMEKRDKDNPDRQLAAFEAAFAEHRRRHPVPPKAD